MPRPRHRATPGLRRSLVLLVAAIGCAASSATRSPAADGGLIATGTEILWDSYGVPHIYAANRQGIAYAFGWAQMRNHADLMLRLVAQARGRAIEYLGADYVDEDRWVWTLDLPAHAERLLDAQPPDMRAHLDAFVAGINAFARTHPGLVSDSVRAVLPVKPVDILAHLERVQFARFITSRTNVRNATRAWERGSNAWAVAPRRSASGNAMLLANPHLPWSDLFTWTEAQYTAPGVSVYGAALVLSPVLQIAFNDALGWTHTVNTQDGEDLYELTLSGDGYRWDGGVRAFERREHVMRIREPNGRLREDTLRVRQSVHGPVVNERSGKAIALAAVGLHGPQLELPLVQWWNMGQARTFEAFLAAIRPNQISGQNITYADRAGHIMVFYGGNTPVRPGGDRAFWAGIIPGDTSATLWTTLHGFDDMPRTVDPPTGYVQNANDPPWWATFPVQVRPDQFPAYLATRPMALRPQQSVRLLDADSSITFAEFVEYANSSRILLADRVLDDLLAGAAASPDDEARRAADVLARWDRTADAPSRGGVLFVEWWSQYRQRRAPRPPFAVTWNINAPRATPAGVADTALAVAALASAADSVRRIYGRLDVAWGDVYRLRRDTVDLPASGAAGDLGVFRNVGFEESGRGTYEAVGGTSFVAAIEFSDPVRARTMVTYGNASRTGSRHRVDQLPLFAAKQFKTAWLTRAEVEAHVLLRERF